MKFEPSSSVSFLPSPSSRGQLSEFLSTYNELIEFFAELTEFAAELSELSLLRTVLWGPK